MYDEHLNDRIRQVFREKKIPFEEKKMMGGICYMVNDKMCVGVIKNKLMARINPDACEEAMKRPGCREMDFTHRPMKGYVFVEPEGTDMDKDLESWIGLALEFNPLAKNSKEKKAKKK
jgi:TfoX/Sxy family transcriptional regulator of competence genes